MKPREVFADRHYKHVIHSSKKNELASYLLERSHGKVDQLGSGPGFYTQDI